MQIALKNKKKATIDSPRNVFKRKNKVEEGGASGLRVKREQDSINLRAQKMMRGRVEPFVVPTMVTIVLIVVQEIKQTLAIPQMTSPQEKQLREQNQEVKREHDIRFLESEKHLHFEGDVYEDWIETIQV